MNVSIIIPTYNVAPYIRKCLESVAAQTYTGSMECLVVDDCGQDNSIEIAENFIKEYRGNIDFRIIYREKNGGLSAARNSGIREAKGDYLYFLDSDDWIVPECVKELIGCLKRYPEAEIVQAGAIVNGEGFKWMDFTKKEIPEYSNDIIWIKKALSKRTFLSVTAWGKLIKKDFVEKNRLFFDEGYIYEDEIYNVRIALVLKHLAICKNNLYVYEVRETSIMGQNCNENILLQKRFPCWYKIYEYLQITNDSILVEGLLIFINFNYCVLTSISEVNRINLRKIMEKVAILLPLNQRFKWILWLALPYPLQSRFFFYKRKYFGTK